MSISRADVEHLASLARLTLTSEELDHYADQLGVILDSVSKVSEIATADVPATSHPVPMENVFRDDVRAPGLSASDALAAAPAVEDERFRVPRILDES